MWHDPEGNKWNTYSIVTTQANKEMLEIHHRQPVILQPKQEQVWLDPGNDEVGSLDDIMQPYRNGGLEIYRVDTRVNSGRAEGKELIHPLSKTGSIFG